MDGRLMDTPALFYEMLHGYVDERSLKIVHVKKVAGKKHIAGIYHKDVTGMGLEALTQEVQAGIASLKTSVRRVTVVLPSQYAITKNIEVPSLDKDEIENIIRLQAVRHTPYSKEEVIVGHINLERLLDRYTKALLVIVSNENIQKNTDVFERAGFEIEAVHLSSDVLVKIVNELRPFVLAESPYGLVYVQSGTTDFIIVHNAKPYFIRSIPLGAAQVKQDAAGAMKQLSDELRKTCEAYQSEDRGSPIKRFLVAGADTGQADLVKHLSAEFTLEAEVVRVDGKLSVSEEAGKILRSPGDNAFLDVVGDALIHDDATVDLLPHELRVRKSFRQKGKEIFTAAIFVMAIMGLLAGIFGIKIYFRNQYLNEITQNFEVKQKEAAELDAISEKTRLVRDFRHKKGKASQVLANFEKLLPENMYLSEITLAEDGKVTVKGTSLLMSTVFSFVTELENNPQFKNVTSDYTKSRKENDREVSDFGLSALTEEEK